MVSAVLAIFACGIGSQKPAGSSMLASSIFSVGAESSSFCAIGSGHSSGQTAAGIALSAVSTALAGSGDGEDPEPTEDIAIAASSLSAEFSSAL